MFGLGIFFWIARGIFEGVGGFTGGYMPQHYYATRNDREAGLLTAEWVCLLLFRWLLIVGVALLALGISRANGDIAALLTGDPEKALPIVVERAIPAGLRGLLVAGLMAAAMSTFDSTVNAGAAYWVRDIYQMHIRPHASPRAAMRQSYAATVGFAAVAVVLGMVVKNINAVWSWIIGPLTAGLFAPVILRWYWWRFNGYGFATSTGVGLIVAIVLMVVAPGTPFYLSFVITLAGSFFAGVVGSYVTAPTPMETLRTFWLRIRPFGLWNSVTASMNQAAARRARAQSKVDIRNDPLAVGWHVVGVVAVISLLLHKWSVVTVATVTIVLLSVVLYFSWYRSL